MDTINHRIEVDYSHKPARINSIQDLISFYEGIPDEAWCQRAREDECGRRCAVGHYWIAYNGWLRSPLYYRDHEVMQRLESSLMTRNDRAPLGTPKAGVIDYLSNLLPVLAPVPAQTVDVTLTVVASGCGS